MANLGDKSSKGKKTVWQKGYPARLSVTSNGNYNGGRYDCSVLNYKSNYKFLNESNYGLV